MHSLTGHRIKLSYIKINIITSTWHCLGLQLLMPAQLYTQQIQQDVFSTPGTPVLQHELGNLSVARLAMGPHWQQFDKPLFYGQLSLGIALVVVSILSVLGNGIVIFIFIR